MNLLSNAFMIQNKAFKNRRSTVGTGFQPTLLCMVSFSEQFDSMAAFPGGHAYLKTVFTAIPYAAGRATLLQIIKMSGLYHEIISPLMNSENSIVKDPLGNIVFLSEELCLREKDPFSDMYDPIARIIEAPAYMVEVTGSELYYIRAVDWDNIMLVEASMQSGKWKASTCVRNPSREFIGSIIKRGKLITKW